MAGASRIAVSAGIKAPDGLWHLRYPLGNPPSGGLSIRVFNGGFVDGNNNPINLRGVNVGGTGYVNGGTNFWSGEGWPSTIDMVTLATFRANIVRLSLSQACILGQTTLVMSSCLASGTVQGTYAVPPTLPGTAVFCNCDADGQFTAKLKAAVDMFTAAGYYVVLDLHFTAPDVVIGGTTYHVHNNGSSAQQTMPDSVNAPLALAKLATQYASYSNVMIECYNEPGSIEDINWHDWLNGKTNTQFNVQDFTGAINQGTYYQFTYTWTSAGMQALVTAIRSGTGFAGPIIVGGIEYGAELGNDGFFDTSSTWVLSRPTDPLNNMVASLHCYSGFKFKNTGTIASGNANIAVINDGSTALSGGQPPSILGAGSVVTFETTRGNIIAGTSYYVVSSTSSSIQISTTYGGSVLTPTGSGSSVIDSGYGGGNYNTYYASDNNPFGSNGSGGTNGFRQWIKWVQQINAAGYACVMGEYGGVNTAGVTVEPFVTDVTQQIDGINAAKTGGLASILWTYATYGGTGPGNAPISISGSGVASISGPTGTVAFNWMSGHA